MIMWDIKNKSFITAVRQTKLLYLAPLYFSTLVHMYTYPINAHSILYSLQLYMS